MSAAYPPVGGRLRIEVIYAGALDAGASVTFDTPGVYVVVATLMSGTAILWDILKPDGSTLLGNLTINGANVAIGGGFKLRVRNAGTSTQYVYIARWVVE